MSTSRFDLWSYAFDSPVYERPLDVTRWPVPLSGTQAAGYVPWMVPVKVPQREPLGLTVVGHPSVTIRREGADGPTAQEITLQTSHPERLSQADLRALVPIVEQWVAFCRNMSQGSLGRTELRRLGHPYGYRAGPTAWQRLGPPRGSGQLFRSGWHRKGVQGAVPPLSVINRDSGWLAENWFGEVRMTSTGAQVRVVNLASYSWFLAHGTYKMAAHGPWTEAVNRYLADLQQAWRNLVRRAWPPGGAAVGIWGQSDPDRNGPLARFGGATEAV